MKKQWKQWKRFLNGMTNRSIINLGRFLVLMAAISPLLSMYPFWHNEAEMPQSIRNRMS